MADTKFSIGIDLGGTNLKGGVVDRSGRVFKRRQVPVVAERSAASVVRQIVEEIEGLKKNSPSPVCAVGCGIPGIVDFDAGVVIRSPNFPEWRYVPMRDEIARAIGFPVTLDNDANMHALGEARFGAGKGRCNMVLLTLGSGIGGGLVLNGEVFHGDSGFAGEVGHLVVDPDGVPCGCGGRGCWEQYAASRGFAVHAERLPAKEREGLLAAAGTDISGLTPELMARLADQGNAIAIKLWEVFGRYLGIGIATLLNILGVETFIIGGGIARSWDRFIDAARREALAHTYSYHADKLVILKTALGDDAGIVGAASQAFAIISQKTP